ncbi:GLPGLI family protein [Flavobacterium zepuense]|uniref:GLPGLI family protein n=1 Tax=Flavobacterium zepuense TaxID=2593302 RepID=A0A552V7F1_9FLAO|nr:GLPGLI family protein [Flavobacterium zepuense]TRW26396.1 GLPGLI family protein [Flavobacterium zepuense]
MKKITYFVLALFGVLTVSAQDFQGVAVYESKTTIPDFRPPGRDRDMTDAEKKNMEDRMKKALEKTFVLTFDKTSANYLEEEKLDAPGENPGFRMMANFMGGGGKHYKNIKEKRFAMEKEVFGKEFLIDDTLPKIQWKLESETKKIGNYNCYKATAVVPTDKSDFRNLRMKKDAAQKADQAKKDENKTTNLMDSVEMPDTVAITAWYTPDIPVSTGPANYWGLPGLILEVTTDKTALLCSKITINPKEKQEIRKPAKGKKVTQAEYEDIVAKKMEEMRQMGGAGGPGSGRPPRMN